MMHFLTLNSEEKFQPTQVPENHQMNLMHRIKRKSQISYQRLQHFVTKIHSQEVCSQQLDLGGLALNDRARLLRK